MTDDPVRPSPPFLLAVVGVLLLVAAVHHHWDELFVVDRLVGPLAALAFDGVLAICVVYAGYWVSTTDLPVEGQWTACTYSLAGGVLFAATTGLSIFIHAAEGRSVMEPVFPTLVALEAGMLAGLAAGYNTARARWATAEARRANERLEALNAELEASNERLEQFAYTLSHDLQEPLRMVSSYLQLLEQRYESELDQDAQEFIEFAVDGADRMESMVTSLLTYSRVTAEADSLEPTDADAVLDTVLEDLQRRIEETDATVTADDLPTVQADPDQLAQVFQNLLENALRHSGDDPPRVHVGADRAGDGWEFSVRDEGVGIDDDQQDRIFELFEQGHAPDQGSESVGMGLALCERIVDCHDGDIWVASESGEGATFRFTLPTTDGESANGNVNAVADDD